MRAIALLLLVIPPLLPPEKPFQPRVVFEWSASGAAHGCTGQLIDGRKNPELFLPSELMSVLLSRGRISPQARGTYSNGIARFGWDPTTFWSVIDRAAARYQHHDRFRRDSRDRCVAVAAALAAAREGLGADQFDRFLYTTVAPSMRICVVEDIRQGPRCGQPRPTRSSAAPPRTDR